MSCDFCSVFLSEMQNIPLVLAPVSCDTSHGSTYNLAQAGLLPPPYCFLSQSLGQLYGGSLCLQVELCQRATTSGKPPQSALIRNLEVNPPASCHLRICLEAFCILPGRSKRITAVTLLTFLLRASRLSLLISYPFHVYF